MKFADVVRMFRPNIGGRADTSIGYSADPEWRGVYKIGGITMLLAGILYLACSTIGTILGTPPANSEAYLQSLAAHPLLAQIMYWVYALADVLFIPGILALYLALKGINKNAMLVAVGLLGFFFVLDLGITEMNSVVLATLVQSAASAATDAQRTAFLAAADFGLATMPIASFFSWVGPTSGFLITSFVMLRGVFGKNKARLGMVVCVLGIVAGFYVFIPILSVLLTPVLILYGLWLMTVGGGLLKLRK